MLAPGNPDSPIQLVDGRDLAAFVIDLTERHAAGIYNVNGLSERLTWGECFDRAQMVAGTDSTFMWVSEEFLRAKIG